MHHRNQAGVRRQFRQIRGVEKLMAAGPGKNRKASVENQDRRQGIAAWDFRPERDIVTGKLATLKESFHVRSSLVPGERPAFFPTRTFRAGSTNG
jgi:hypothetical protein